MPWRAILPIPTTVDVVLLEQELPTEAPVKHEGPFTGVKLPGAAKTAVQVTTCPRLSIVCTCRFCSVVQLGGIGVITQPFAPEPQPKVVLLPLPLNAANSGPVKDA